MQQLKQQASEDDNNSYKPKICIGSQKIMKNMFYDNSFNKFNETIKSNQPIDNVLQRSNQHQIHKQNKVK